MDSGDSVSNTEAWHLLSAARSVSGEGGFFFLVLGLKGSRKKQRSIKCGIDASKDGRKFGIDANKDGRKFGIDANKDVCVCVYFVFSEFFSYTGIFYF